MYCYAGKLLAERSVEGCRLKRDVSKDEVLTYADVELRAGCVIGCARSKTTILRRCRP